MTWAVDRAGDVGQMSVFRREHEDLAAAFLIGFSSTATRGNYQAGLKQYFSFADRMGFDPLTAGKHHVDLFIRSLEMRELAPRTVKNRLTVLSSFYAWLVDNERLEKNPAAKVKRPPIPRVSPTGHLRLGQASELITASKTTGPYGHLAVCLLLLNGLRVGEAVSLDLDSVSRDERWTRITFRRKGGQVRTNTLPWTTEAALNAVMEHHEEAGRTAGPLLLTRQKSRTDQQWHARILERCRPAITNCPARLHPHLLRHTFVYLCKKENLPPERIANDCGWADLRQVSYYGAEDTPPALASSHRIDGLVSSL